MGQRFRQGSRAWATPDYFAARIEGVDPRLVGAPEKIVDGWHTVDPAGLEGLQDVEALREALPSGETAPVIEAERKTCARGRQRDQVGDLDRGRRAGPARRGRG